MVNILYKNKLFYQTFKILSIYKCMKYMSLLNIVQLGNRVRVLII